jgi:hypothetical protein
MKDCVIWQKCKDRDGYGRASINGKKWQAHRWAYTEAYGDIPEGMVVRHMCHNPACINPEHLVIGTHADNVRDKLEANRQLKGEDVPSSKLTEAQVKEIKELKGKISGPKLADKFNVHFITIYKIWNRKTWKHIHN